EQFNRLGKLYADSPEGVAAQLDEARLEREAGRYDRALDEYRAVLDYVVDADRYMNELAPLPVLRLRLLEAYRDFLSKRLFSEALSLVDMIAPVYSVAEQLELRAETHRQWADSLVAEADVKGRWRTPTTLRSARYQYRAAGRAFEDLARLRFATREFPDDLWQAAENYYQGQSYTNAARTTEEYLRHEARRLGAQALLRLGQCHLARRSFDDAVLALEECMDAYPDDAVVYRARLECARAEQMRNHFARAEELLRLNLMGDALTPDSVDWRDSKFDIGRLYYETGRYEDAIAHLQEAVARYPQADEAVVARYTVARANHAAADEPAKNLAEAKTENERQKNRTLMNDYLNAALDAYLTVQRTITLSGQGESSPLHRGLLRNCYMMQGAVLYELHRYEEAQKAFANVSNLYQNDPFVLESYVQMANCWRRLNQPIKARGTIRLARSALENMPPNADFRSATNFTRQQWQFVLDSMYQW
ncbi:MAG: tetratricopeptide repeat protein, partial [Planctomycetales bacterium]|nr:tetratricopeptide repeat protein [Planctomycetales bacterium]